MGSLGRKVLVILICTWVISNIFLICIPEKAAGPIILPIATISLVQTNQTADVSPGATGIVIFDGTVSCVFNSATTAIVSLEATDTWNSAIVTPSALEFSSTNPGAKTFQVSVKAPLYTSHNVVGQMIVTGMVVMYPSTLIGTVQPSDGVTGRIDIAQFYGFSLRCNQTYIESYPDSEVIFDVSIQNIGNGWDTLSICLKDCDHLINRGFRTFLSTDTIDIYEIDTHVVNIQIIVPDHVTSKNEVFSFAVEVTSEGCKMNDESTKISIATQSELLTFVIVEKPKEYDNDDYGYTENEKDSTKSTSFLPGFEAINIFIGILIVILLSRRLTNNSRKRLRKIK